jgi:hypothetical protein
VQDMSNRSWHINTLFQVLDSSKYLKLLVPKLLLINFEVAQLVKLDANFFYPGLEGLISQLTSLTTVAAYDSSGPTMS